MLLCCLFVAAFVGTTNWKRSGVSEMKSDVFFGVPQNVTVDHHFPHDIGHLGVTPYHPTILLMWITITQLPGCLEVYVRGKAIRWWLRLGAAWNQGCSKLIVCFEHLWTESQRDNVCGTRNLSCGGSFVGHQLVKSLKMQFIDVGCSGDRVQLSQWGN